MKVVRNNKFHGRKVVTVAEVTEVNDEAVLEVAMNAANETKSRLFGWNVTYYEEDETTGEMSAVVSLYTD